MKHPLDHRPAHSERRVRVFMSLSKQQGAEGSHPATKTALRRPKMRGDDATRLRQFVRIARGHTA